MTEGSTLKSAAQIRRSAGWATGAAHKARQGRDGNTVADTGHLRAGKSSTRTKEYPCSFLSLDRAQERRDELTRELERHQRAVRTSTANAGTIQRIDNIATGLAELDDQISEMEKRGERVAQIAAAGSVEQGFGGHESTRTLDNSPAGVARTEVLRTIEGRSSELGADASDRLDTRVRRDRFGADSRYVAAAGNPDYAEAFGRKLMGTSGAAAVLSPAEGQAMMDMERAYAERSMLVGDGPSGGYALPLALDPTVVVTNEGVTDPIRNVARVITTTSYEWRGVSSEGTSASFAQEGDEVGDGTPTLSQPKIKPERAHGFVPFTYEIGQDWTSLQAELARLFADAKTRLEAVKFINGTGTDEPQGIVTGLDAVTPGPGSGSGSGDDIAAVVRLTDGANAIALSDVYGLQESLDPRWQVGASWLSSLAVANKIDQLSGGPGSDTPLLFDSTGTRILRKPWAECSTLPSAVTDGNDVLLYGDWRSAYTIVDRIGMSVEIIQNLTGQNGRPVGVRGLYAFWRVGAGLTVPSAGRALQVSASGSGS